MTEKTFVPMVKAHLERPDMMQDGGVNMTTFMMDLQQLFEMGMFKLDLNGHFLSNSSRSREYYVNRGGEDSYRFIHSITCPYTYLNAEHAQRTIDACVSGETTDPIVFKASQFCICEECGERLEFSFDGQTLKAVNPCQKPDGCLPYTFEIDCSTGRLYVANDLRSAWPDVDEMKEYPPKDGKTRDINTRIGSANVTLDYAAEGLAHVFVGNSCPGVYRTEDGFVIGCSAWQEPEDEDDEEIEIPIPGALEPVASICTDLWWYCIVDEQQLLSRFIKHVEFKGTFEEWVKQRNCEVIEVEPGLYQFEVLPYDGEDYKSPTVYTRFKRIGDSPKSADG